MADLYSISDLFFKKWKKSIDFKSYYLAYSLVDYKCILVYFCTLLGLQ